MRLRSVLVYSTLLGSVAVGAATAGLDPADLRANFSRWSESACERLRIDLCLYVEPGAETRSKQVASNPDRVASNRRLWTDPPAHREPAAVRSTWRDSDGGHADAAIADVATTGGVPAAGHAIGAPSASTEGQGPGAMPLPSDPEASSVRLGTDEEPQPASARDAPVVSSLGMARPDGSTSEGRLTIGPADLPPVGAAEDGDAGAMNPDPAGTSSLSTADPEPDLTPVPFPPMRPETPKQANLADPVSPALGESATTERSDAPNPAPKVEGPNGGAAHDRRRTARRMSVSPVAPSVTSRGTSRGGRMIARTGRGVGTDEALRPRRPVQLPDRLLPDDLP